MLGVIWLPKFSWLTLDSLLVTWHNPVASHRVLQQPPSSSRANYLLQTLDVCFSVEVETMWKDELKHNITIAIDHPQTL